jgi:hypothetical protein
MNGRRVHWLPIYLYLFGYEHLMTQRCDDVGMNMDGPKTLYVFTYVMTHSMTSAASRSRR